VDRDIRDMNVTITMHDETLRWVRVEAAKAGLSVSRWVGVELEQRFEQVGARAAAARRIEAFLDAGPRFDLSQNGKISLDRDELHDDGRFRRFDDPALYAGSQRSGQAGPLDAVAEEARRFEHPGDKPSGRE
jgi:hypothetical protein